MVDKKREFALELINFYKEFLLGSSKSVSILANIQEKYPKEYEILKKIKDDPQAIMELTKLMEEKDKDTFILIVVESSNLGQRMNRLFDLTQKEKEDLATDIATFANKVEDKLKDLAKIEVKSKKVVK